MFGGCGGGGGDGGGDGRRWGFQHFHVTCMKLRKCMWSFDNVLGRPWFMLYA
jgi:hypothetical protein